jgi:hypothetical protein
VASKFQSLDALFCGHSFDGTDHEISKRSFPNFVPGNQ